MASREEMLQTIKDAYEARRTGDIEGLMSAFHANSAFELKGTKDLLHVCERFEGHARVRSCMSELANGFVFLQRDILDTIVEGDRVVIRSRVQVKFIPKDKTITTEILDMFRFQDNKIAELVEFTDTALVKDTVGA
jgi:ketosteroid isomerase-like protein